MPLPTPIQKESETDFVKRFMNNPVMKEEYKDVKQRVAVAYSTYRKAKGGKK
jgi:hypothetical protein